MMEINYDLDSDAEKTIHKGLEWGQTIIKDYTMDDPPADISPEFLDDLYVFWRDKWPGEKPSEKVFSWAIGCIWGKFIIDNSNRKWAIVKDEFGEGLCVVEPTSEWVTNPIVAVAKRTDPDSYEDGFFSALWDVFCLTVLPDTKQTEEPPEPTKKRWQFWK